MAQTRVGVRQRPTSNIVTDGLVLHLDAGNTSSYPGTGTIWSDLTSNDNDGTLINGPVYNSSNGGTISFDGVNDYVDTGTINFGQIYTLNIWVKLDDLNSRIWIGGVNTTEYHMNFHNGRLYSRLSNSRHYFDTQIITNQWYNLTLVRNNTSVDCYKNGSFISNSTNSIYNKDFILYRIGCSPGGFFGNGNMSITSFYNKVLTEQEIQQNYNATKGRFGL